MCVCLNVTADCFYRWTYTKEEKCRPVNYYLRVSWFISRVFPKGIFHVVLAERTFQRNEFRRKLNDALVAYFRVLYSTLTSRAESTQNAT